MLNINPFEPIFQDAFQRLLNNIPPGTFLLKHPIILPLRENQTTNFIVTTDIGTRFDVTLNNGPAGIFTAVSTATTVPLILQPGINVIQVTSAFESFTLSVAAVNYATYLSGWAEEWFFNVQIRVDDHQNQLLSRFSLRQLENQISFQDLLPATRVMRILAGKMAVKSILNLGGGTEGVNEIVTAVSGTTPVVVPTIMDDLIFEPAMRPILLRAHDFGGFSFHLWLLNLCATSWATFINLANNLPNRIIRLVSATDQKVVVDRAGRIETHLFDFDGPGCSIIDILTRFLDCFARIRMWVKLNLHSRYAFCGYTYALDTVVDSPIGCRLFDTGHPFDSGSFDSCEESDPFAAALGWLGLPLTRRLDASVFLDSMSGRTFPPETPNCAFDRPEAVIAGSGRLDQPVIIGITGFTTLTIT